MAALQVDQTVSVAFDNRDSAARVKARVVKLGHAFASGQRYLIEVIEVIRPSRYKESPPVGSLREVAEFRLSALRAPASRPDPGLSPSEPRCQGTPGSWCPPI